MKFQKKVSPEKRKVLRDELIRYKKAMVLSADELDELEQWVSSGHSPYDNGNYLYTEFGTPMDFISAMRFQEDEYDDLMSLSEEERQRVNAERCGGNCPAESSVAAHIPLSYPFSVIGGKLPFPD